MKFGLFYELLVPRPWTRESERAVYLNALEQVTLADELGFDFSERPWTSFALAASPSRAVRWTWEHTDATSQCAVPLAARSNSSNAPSRDASRSPESRVTYSKHARRAP